MDYMYEQNIHSNNHAELMYTNVQFQNEINLANTQYEKFFEFTNYLEQKQLEKYVEIFGIPEEENEDCISVVKMIASKLNIDLSVIRGFRKYLYGSNRSSKIVAEFSIWQEKKSFMEAIKLLKPNAQIFNDNWIDSPIFVNDFLTNYNRYLFYK